MLLAQPINRDASEDDQPPFTTLRRTLNLPPPTSSSNAYTHGFPGSSYSTTTTVTLAVDPKNSTTPISKASGNNAIKDRPPPSYPQSSPLDVALIETNGVHEEVFAALVHSFGSKPEARLHFYKEEPRYDIQGIVAEFELWQEPPEWQAWEALQRDDIGYHPSILILITCYSDPLRLASRLRRLLEEGKTFIYCVVHETARWDGPDPDLDEILKPWAQKGLLDFIVLSPAVARTLEEKGMRTWPRRGAHKVPRSVRTFPPIFPVRLPPLPAIVEDQDDGIHMNNSFAIQGIFDPERRNFEVTFAHLERFINDKAKQMNDSTPAPLEDTMQKPEPPYPIEHSPVHLHLIGHGEERPKIPERLRQNIFIHENLNYHDFYNLLSQQSALLPAFSSDKYRWMKASSSIACSLIAGTPLVVDENILRAYSYLGEDAVYVQKNKETEFDALGKVLEGSYDHVVEKRRRVRLRASQVIEQNKGQAREWITKAGVEIGRYRDGHESG
ncbi:uncharacterized protein KY384_008694 [Bacidia gigantensis]|uniref:uncharacterized protein n=1 Tax=Bacidia gigantensis TaxID=2732470 RepID=UPI001D0432CA|nr:uncharacterized protein KY384_008694 [Bacidia gigantensis]KAG8526494.1 hypothetical protein KY384_008694 [Bacidia gigantensis]